jgi:hypothetical protein
LLLPGLTAAGWPEGMRVLVRRERPHPGAQISLMEAHDGWRYQCVATDTDHDSCRSSRPGTGPTPTSRTGQSDQTHRDGPVLSCRQQEVDPEDLADGAQRGAQAVGR